MSEAPNQNDFLDDIERRQDDILRQLDELNQQIEQTLKVHSPSSIAPPVHLPESADAPAAAHLPASNDAPAQPLVN